MEFLTSSLFMHHFLNSGAQHFLPQVLSLDSSTECYLQDRIVSKTNAHVVGTVFISCWFGLLVFFLILCHANCIELLPRRGHDFYLIICQRRALLLITQPLCKYLFSLFHVNSGF